MDHEAPLTREEIAEWVASLARTDHVRVRILLDLLAHVVEDQMSAADQAICEAELRAAQDRIMNAKRSRLAGYDAG